MANHTSAERRTGPVLVRQTDAGYFDLRALSVYSGVCVRSLRSYLADADNPIPHFRMRGKILVSKTEFDAWVISHRVTPKKDDTKAVANKLYEAHR